MTKMKTLTLSYIHFLIILNLFIYSCCDDIDCENCISDGFNCFKNDASNGQLCDQKCKPNYGVGSNCYLCNFEGYYYIGTTTISRSEENICNSGCEGDFIIDSTKECVPSSTEKGTLKKMGNVYYKNCPLYSQSSDDAEDDDDCKCLYKYYIETYNGKKIYHCLSPTSLCPDEMKLYDYETKQCYSGDDCSGTGNIIKKYEDNGNIRCHTSCIGEEFYKKLRDDTEICVDSCESYIYIDNSDGDKKLCLNNCEETNIENIKIKNNYCVLDSQCNFYDGDICLNSCKESNGKPYHKKDDKECIPNCGELYLNKNDNICYQEADCNFIKEISGQKICLSECNVEDGFISTESSSNQCYNYCPNLYKYYNHGENICLNKCSINNKIYHKKDGFECFSSCKDIDDGTLIYAVEDNGGYACQSSPPTTGCDYYFPINNGVKLCVALNYCTERHYDYLKGKECLEECNDFKAIDNSGASSSPIKCLLDLSDCINDSFKLYNNNEKKCWKKLPNGYCRKPNTLNDGSYEIIPINDKYYFEEIESGNQIKYCVSSCKAVGKFIDFVDKKRCISECSKESSSGGTTTKTYYFYDPRNNECHETCIGTGYEFAEPLSSTSENANPCLLENGEKFYYESDKLLIDSCNSDYHKSLGSKICVSSCPYFIDVDSSTCVSDCGEKFISDTNKCITTCDNYIINIFGKKECLGSGPTNNCLNKGKFYFSSNPSKCIDECSKILDNGTKKYLFYNSGENKCIESCKDNSGNNKYADEPISNHQQCKDSCGSKFYYDNEKICRETSCSLFKASNSKECVTECGPNQKVDENNICVDSCGTSPFIVEEEIDIKGVKKTIKKCITKTCHEYSSSYQFIYSSTNGKECLKSCHEGLYKIGNYCYNKCESPNIFLDPSTSTCSSVCSTSFEHYEELADYPGIYICKQNCEGKFKYSISGKFKCVSECPSDANHITNGNECKSSCGNGEKEIIKDVKDSYTIYECISSCKDDLFYSESEKKCFSVCKGNDKNFPYSLTKKDSTGHIIERKCDSSCDNDENSFKYYNNIEYKCMESCDLLIEDTTNRCTDKCDDEHYKFKYGNQCKAQCPSGHNRYLRSDYECVDKCIEPNIFLPQEGFECISECEEGQYKEIIYDNDDEPTGEYRCVRSYRENEYYYKNDKILISECNSGHYVIEDTHECIEDCNLINNNRTKYYYYEPDEGATTDNIRTCVLSCSKGGKTFYDGNHCKASCEDKFYKNGERICLETCPSGYYIDGQVCVSLCKTQNTNKYLYNNQCVQYCPNGDNDYKFYIEPDNECLPDCNLDNKYYTEIEVDTSNTKYLCHGTCDKYYLVNEDPNIIARKCLNLGADKNCKTENYYSSENNEYECYTKCPENTYIDEENKKCLSTCPKYKYHEKNSKICIKPSECQFKIADFHSGECVQRCNTKYTSDYMEDTVVSTICLESCGDVTYGQYSTPNNKCVNNCGDFSEFSQVDTSQTKCECKNLYYFNQEANKFYCIDVQKNFCFDVGNDYKIQIFETKECIKKCGDNYIKSLNGEFCYKYEQNACSYEEDRPSQVTTVLGTGKKCECKFKYFIDNNSKKHCLEEFSQCSQLYIPETMECVNNCQAPFIKKFKDFCLRECPSGSKETGDECKCGDEDKNLWYSVGTFSFICLGDGALCPDNYPALAPQNNQCLKKCKDSYYPYLYDGKCYSGCDHISVNSISKDIDNDLAKKTCICQKPWYYDDDNKMHCPDSTEEINYCSDYSDLNLEFMIHDTKQCVKQCPSNYPYYFNQECFTNCEYHANSVYNYISKRDSYECQCSYLWYYVDETHKQKKCLDSYHDLCINIEGVNKPYLIYDTNQCIEECPSQMYIFNMTCYYKCPEFTKDLQTADSDRYTCSCDKEIDAYWYKYELSGKTFYGCGIFDCPDFIPNLIKDKKQCITKCEYDDDYKFTFEYYLRKICIEDCPEDYTIKDTDNSICKFHDLSNDATNKEDLKKYANPQAKELYENGDHLGGYLFNKFEDVSLQIYAIDKDDTLKEYATKSNLTYIDLGTCLPKIYEDKKMRKNDKILVVKYDLSNSEESGDGQEEAHIGDKYLINKVEYELYNSRTMERIDATICDPNEIIISYPIVYNKNKFDNYDSGFNNNEYKKKFEIGKKLYQNNPKIDTFNSNDSLYKDLCIGIEIDGKDLVFEDRYEVLYPNGALLCESNCTYNNTDFEEERVNCICNYKEDIDFNRVEEGKNDLINDPNFNLPKQSSSNLNVIKCLSKISIKNAILKNEAFYYCAAVTVVVASMVFVTAFYGINAISKNIFNILNKVGNKNNNILNNYKKDIYNNERNISTSHRMLNNPPKKNVNEINSENNNNDSGNIINKKDLEINYNINNNLVENEDEFSQNNENNINYNLKAEYLPPQYNFKYFKSSDKGVKKQIERKKLPFKVNDDVKYLLERRNGVIYNENYLKGPFYTNQNIIEILDKTKEDNVDNIKKNNNNKEVIYNKIQDNIDNDIIVQNKTDSPNKKNLNMNMNMRNINNNKEENKEKDFITIKKIRFRKNEPEESYEQYEEINNKKEEDLGLYTLIKREQALLRISYEKYMSKDHPNILSIFLAEILDKVYLIKICLFLKKYEIFSLHLSLYLFFHILLLTLCCSFFTIKTIKKIWKEDNYPGMQYYLLYGIITNIIVWAVYKIFLCLLDIQDNVKELIKLKSKNNNENNADNNNFEINGENIENNLNQIMKTLKCRIIIFYIIIFVFIVLFTLYLISFFSIYTGTKDDVLLAYIISIIEILVIKLVYGICMASLRIASEGNELKSLYKIVYILNKYLS